MRGEKLRASLAPGYPGDGIPKESVGLFAEDSFWQHALVRCGGKGNLSTDGMPGRWREPAQRIRWRWQSRVIAWFARTETWADIVGALTGRKRCLNWNRNIEPGFSQLRLGSCLHRSFAHTRADRAQPSSQRRNSNFCRCLPTRVIRSIHLTKKAASLGDCAFEPATVM